MDLAFNKLTELVVKWERSWRRECPHLGGCDVSAAKVFQSLEVEQLGRRQHPDRAHVRATCNASLRRDVSGFCGKRQRIKPPDLPSVKTPLKSVNHETRGRLKFPRYHKTQKSAITRYLPSHPTFTRLPVIGTERFGNFSLSPLSGLLFARAREEPLRSLRFFGDW